MRHIERLTADQQDLLAVRHAEWLAVGRSTAPADRAAAEQVFTAMYAAIGRPAPRVLWVASPATAALAHGVLSARDSLGASLRASLRESLWESLWDSLGDSLGASLWTSLWTSLGGSLWTSLRTSLGASLWESLGASLGASLRASLGESLRESLGASLGDYFWGQHEAYWIAFYAFAIEIGVSYRPQDAERLGWWVTLARSCGWWWPYEGLVLASDRPELVRQETIPDRVVGGFPVHRLHATDGPALRYRDGWAVYAIHGVRVPERVVVQPETITAREVLAERNVEVARVMREQMGPRFVAEANPTFIHEDTDSRGNRRRLLDIAAPNVPDRRIVLVEVICPSTGRVYLNRVPPTVRTCVEAVAWRVGVDVERYRPLVEA